MDRADIADYKLRRLGRRSLRVLERHKDKNASIAAFEHTLVPAVQRLEEAGAQVESLAELIKGARREGQGSVVALSNAIRRWLALLVRDLRGFDTSRYLIRDVPDDVINDGQRLVEIVNAYHQENESPLPYGEQLLSELGGLILSAETEWAQAQDAMTTLQELRAQRRSAGVALQRELVAFRRSLRATIGTTARDYRKLRADRAGQPDADDGDEAGDAIEPLPAEAVDVGNASDAPVAPAAAASPPRPTNGASAEPTTDRIFSR